MENKALNKLARSRPLLNIGIPETTVNQSKNVKQITVT